MTIRQIIIFFIFLNSSLSIYSQESDTFLNDTLNKTDIKGLKQGYWKRYKEIDGENLLVEEGMYLNDLKTGKWTEYYGNGKPKTRFEFKNGKPEGKTILFFDNGKAKEVGTWKNNKWVGEYWLYYESADQIKLRLKFNKDGKREGWQRYYYANGNILSEGKYVDGKEDSVFTIYSYSGEIIGRQEFENGLETFASMSSRNFDIDKLNTQCDSIDKVYATKNEKYSSNAKVTTLYNKNNQMTKTGIFKNNKLIDGKAYFYDKKGNLSRIAIYKEGQYVDDEFNANLTEEEKLQKEFMAKLKSKDDEISAMKALLDQKLKEVEQKDNLLKEQTVENQLLTKEKQIKELLLAKQNADLINRQSEALKKEMQINNLNQDKKIREFEYNNQRIQNEKTEQEVKLLSDQKTYQENEIKQQKFIRNIIAGGLVIVIFLSFFMFNTLQKNKKASKIILSQKHALESKNDIIEQKHKEISDSINYAERIQHALLANKKILNENLANYFILFKPKAVVSGDFYWASKLSNGNFILATADSTGHGVPGAIMSIVNIACLDKAITKGISSPDMILNETRKLIIENLKNDGSEEGGKDGMDGSLLSFDFKTKTLQYAAANSSVWVISGQQVFELEMDRMPIGKHDKDETPFTLNEFQLQSGDMIYTATDGFVDQFGGTKGKKFKNKQLQDLLLTIAQEPLENQKQKLNTVFDEWKGSLEQIDDVTLIGIKV
jgi:serine phosphatase RsbU (regulator of sigma subunit)/antitoxin component YwqK of YwqJK toxin-antitoxin module